MSIVVALSLSLAALTLSAVLVREMRLRRAVQRLAVRLLAAWRNPHEEATEIPDRRAAAADRLPR